ncbi:MAG: hypothetical protein AB7G12_01715 [Thermoanaerobaculia bacterium]
MTTPTTPSASRTARPALGLLLERFGLLSHPDLERALARQAREGGRLGTCLLDLHLLDEETLLAALGTQLGVEVVPPGRLDDVGRENARLLPERAAFHAHAAPLGSSESGELEVAMMDPTDLVLRDELTAVAGRKVRPRLALEVRIAEALEKIYGREESERLKRTRVQLARRARLAAG